MGCILNKNRVDQEKKSEKKKKGRDQVVRRPLEEIHHPDFGTLLFYELISSHKWLEFGSRQFLNLQSHRCQLFLSLFVISEMYRHTLEIWPQLISLSMLKKNSALQLQEMRSLGRLHANLGVNFTRRDLENLNRRILDCIKIVRLGNIKNKEKREWRRFLHTLATQMMLGFSSTDFAQRDPTCRSCVDVISEDDLPLTSLSRPPSLNSSPLSSRRRPSSKSNNVVDPKALSPF